MSLAAGGASASSLLSAGTSIAGGIIGRKDAEAAAEFREFEATQQGLEARRVAIQELERVNRIQARQFAAVGASGFGFTGSAIEPALESGQAGRETFQLGQLGAAVAQQAGVAEAEAIRNRGRLALISGVVGGIGAGLELTQIDFGRGES